MIGVYYPVKCAILMFSIKTLQEALQAMQTGARPKSCGLITWLDTLRKEWFPSSGWQPDSWWVPSARPGLGTKH